MTNRASQFFKRLSRTRTSIQSDGSMDSPSPPFPGLGFPREEFGGGDGKVVSFYTCVPKEGYRVFIWWHRSSSRSVWYHIDMIHDDPSESPYALFQTYEQVLRESRNTGQFDPLLMKCLIHDFINSV